MFVNSHMLRLTPRRVTVSSRKTLCVIIAFIFKATIQEKVYGRKVVYLLIPMHAMNAYGGREVLIHRFLT